jgi:putative IMPACT (imprinted ancient) family translation regulator
VGVCEVCEDVRDWGPGKAKERVGTVKLAQHMRRSIAQVPEAPTQRLQNNPSALHVCWAVQVRLTSQEARHEEVKQAPQLQGTVLDGCATQHKPVLGLEALHSLVAAHTQPAAATEVVSTGA